MSFVGVLFWCFTSLFVSVFSTDTPLVGILSLPCYSDGFENCPSAFVNNPISYIPASYVKWLEGGGARVVPILSDADPSFISNSILPKLNGVLFTGGAAEFDDSCFWWVQLNNILSFMRKFTESTGKSIPLWATCLGFQGLVCANAKGGNNVLGNRYAEDDPLPIDFTSDAATSRIFDTTMDKSYSSDVYNVFANQNVSQNAHKYGIGPSDFSDDEYLTGNFSLLGTSIDIYGYDFVTLIESLDSTGQSWYGSQFHPEKVQYVYDSSGNKNCNHGLNSVFANQYLAEFFVNECRIKNDNTMDTNTYYNYVIYNYKPWFLIKNYTGVSYEQVYIFEDAKSVYGY